MKRGKEGKGEKETEKEGQINVWVGDNRREGSEIRLERTKANRKQGKSKKKGAIRGVKRTIEPALLLVCVPSVLAGCKAVVCKSLREVIHNGTLTRAHARSTVRTLQLCGQGCQERGSPALCPVYNLSHRY